MPVSFSPTGTPDANVQLQDPITVYSSGTNSPNLTVNLAQGVNYNFFSGLATGGIIPIPIAPTFTPTTSIWSLGVSGQVPIAPNGLSQATIATTVAAVVIHPDGTNTPFPAATPITEATAGAAIVSAVASATGAVNASWTLPFSGGGSGAFTITFPGEGITTSSITYSATAATLINNINNAIAESIGEIPTPNSNSGLTTGNSQVNLLDFVDSSGSGTFTITAASLTTAAITYSATLVTLLANITTQLNATFGTGQVVASGVAISGILISFTGSTYQDSVIPTVQTTVLAGSMGYIINGSGTVGTPNACPVVVTGYPVAIAQPQIVATGTTLANITLTCQWGMWTQRPVITPAAAIVSGSGFTVGPAVVAATGAAGDLVCYFRHAQVNQNILKPGVNYYSPKGIRLTNASTNAGFIFSDNGVPSYNVIDVGYLYRTAYTTLNTSTQGDTGVFSITASQGTSTIGSVFTGRCSGADLSFPATVNAGGSFQFTVFHTGGIFSVAFDDFLTSGFPGNAGGTTVPIWWDNGLMLLNARRITTTCVSPAVCMYLGGTDITQGDCFIHTGFLDAGADDNIAVFTQNGVPGAGLWITVDGIIRGQCAIQSGKAYVKGQKQFGQNVCAAGGGATQFFLDLDKQGGSVPIGSTAYNQIGSGVTAQLRIGRFEPLSLAPFVRATTGSIVDVYAETILPLVSQNGIIATGSGCKVTFRTGSITTSVGAIDLVQASGATLNYCLGTSGSGSGGAFTFSGSTQRIGPNV